MSDDAPHNRDRKPPPNLRLGLRDKPEVKALLEELNKDLKPGEDPLFYEMPDSPDDPSACAPNEARVYAGPTAPPVAHHKTLEMDRVKVRPEVDPRRAVTLPGAPRPEVTREDAHGDAPPMSGPASSGPKRSAARNARTRTATAVVLGAVAVALVVLVATRGPKTTGKAPSEAAPNATTTVTPQATAIPSATAIPTATVIPTAPVSSVAPAPGRQHAAPVKAPMDDDPYDAMPSPAVTAAPRVAPAVTAVPSAAPAVTPTAAATVKPTAAPAPVAPASTGSARPAPFLTPGPILGERE